MAGMPRLYVLLGARAEDGETDLIPVPTVRRGRGRAYGADQKADRGQSPGWFTKTARNAIQGVSEETTTGCAPPV